MGRIQILPNNKNSLTIFFTVKRKEYIRYLQNVLESQLQLSLVHLITIILMFCFQVVFWGLFENVFLRIVSATERCRQHADNTTIFPQNFSKLILNRIYGSTIQKQRIWAGKIISTFSCRISFRRTNFSGLRDTVQRLSNHLAGHTTASPSLCKQGNAASAPRQYQNQCSHHCVLFFC